MLIGSIPTDVQDLDTNQTSSEQSNWNLWQLHFNRSLMHVWMCTKMQSVRVPGHSQLAERQSKKPQKNWDTPLAENKGTWRTVWLTECQPEKGLLLQHPGSPTVAWIHQLTSWVMVLVRNRAKQGKSWNTGTPTPALELWRNLLLNPSSER